MIQTDDEWCETTEQPSGVMDTLLEEPDITQDGDRILSFVPGEGNRPLGIFMDNNSEYLSFPTIYYGKRQTDNGERLVTVHYSTMCKWELQSKDRRVAQGGSESLSLRKCKTKGKIYTAGDLKSENSVDKLINLDEGLRVLRNLCCSPSNFERCKKDLFAMVRQLGDPAWFCSFSAADFFYFVEFQQRGSLHIHRLFKIKNATEYGKDCDEDIIKFVDSYVSCKADLDDLSDLVNLQRYKHSKTCKKKGHPFHKL